MAGFDDEEGELFGDREVFHEDGVGHGCPAMYMGDLAQHAHKFLEAVDEMMWDPEVLARDESHVGMRNRTGDAWTASARVCGIVL